MIWVGERWAQCASPNAGWAEGWDCHGPDSEEFERFSKRNETGGLDGGAGQRVQEPLINSAFWRNYSLC